MLELYRGRQFQFVVNTLLQQMGTRRFSDTKPIDPCA